MDRLAAIPMEMLPIDQTILRQASNFAVSHRLLTNDAIIIALMQRHGIVHLVTNDDDFDQVPTITVWKPR